MKRLGKKNILLLVGIILIFSITLGSAIVSSLLQIEGNTNIKGNSWVIYFDSVRKSTDSVASDNDAKITNFEKTRIDFSVNLTEPGDFYEFTVYTVNDGSIDAMVDSVEKSVLTEEQLKYLDFSVTYDNGREIKRCDPLDAHTRKRIKAIVKFKDGVDISDYPDTDTNLNLYFDINYVQKDNACPPDPVGNEKILTIRPHGGVYNGRTDETRIYIEPGKTYEIQDATRFLYNFVRWDVILPETDGTYTLNDNLFTMGNEDVTIEAVWEEGAYVARIMNKYYPSIQEAFDHVDDGWSDNTVYLLKNQNEDPINNATSPFAFNLGGYTVTGQLINSKESNIRLINGKIQAEEDQTEAVRNYGSLTLGTHGGGVQVENSIAIIGNEIGLRNINKNGNYGTFYFYDGYIEAVAALVGGYSGLEEGYYIFSEHIPERNDQRVYLVKNPNRAVAKTETGGVIYYYNLQDAINQASINKRAEDLPDTDYIISAVRNFEAAYKLKVEAEDTIVFDLDGYTVSTGDTVTNNGNFTIKNTSQTSSTLKPSRTFTNTGTLDINNISIRSTTDTNVINNSGTLHLNKSSVQANDAVCITNTGTLQLEKTTISSHSENGVSNTGNGTLSLDENTTITSASTYGLYNSASGIVLDKGTIDGISNSGSITLTGDINAIVSGNKYGLYNNGTAVLDHLELNKNIDRYLFYNNSGTFTILGGSITNNNKGVVYQAGGSTIVDQNAELYSVNSSTIGGSSSTTINSGKVECENTSAVSTTSLVMNNGEVIGKGTGVSVVSLTLNNGSITSDGTGASTSYATVNGGTITGTNYGINSYNDVTITGGVVTASDGVGVDTGSFNMSGGVINGSAHGVITDSMTMSDGTINSIHGKGILLNSNGTITGGTINAETYGIQAKNKITIGTNDDTISSSSPVIVGGLYGLYIEGNDINFYDGILKGQTDGFYGKITGLPTGGLTVDGTETIDGVLYNTDTVNAFKNWLQVGDAQFNNIESACNAITDSGTITVIDDADIRFIQNFVKNEDGSDKNITFDLNGHSIITTQPIYSHTNVTVVDSSNLKTGKITANRVKGLVNELDGEMIINSGEFVSTTSAVPVENRHIMTINAAHINGPDTALRNYGKLTVNDILIDNSPVGIRNSTGDGSDNVSRIRGVLIYNGGNISATNVGINKEGGSLTINGGTIYGINYGIGGDDGSVLVNDGSIKAKDHNALYTYYGQLRVTGGQVISENSTGMVSHSDMFVDGGYVEGTTGVQNEEYCSWLACWYNDIDVTGGHIVGTVDNGIYSRREGSGLLTITGGVIEGKINGVYALSSVKLGADDGNVSTSTPVLIGHTDYGLLHSSYTEFYDGILKGIKDGHYGLVSIIPDAYSIKDDYEYIDRVEYQTDYLVPKGNWLKVGDREFNSINKASQYVSEEHNKMTVIADAYVDFAQTISCNTDITFDFNGHSLIMTQPLKVNTKTRFTNSSDVGGINNLRDNALNLNAETIIDGGVYHSDVTTTITGGSKLTVNGGTIKADIDYAISNSGQIIVNGGEIKGERQAKGITVSGGITVNDGTISSQNQTALYTSGSENIIDGGTINSGKSYAISATDGTLTINNGLIKSNEATAITTGNTYYGSHTLTINNGEIRGNVNGVVSEHGRGSLVVNGGHIIGETGTAVITSSTAYINGGNLEGEQYGLNAKNSSTVTQIGNDDGTINIDAPIIKGDLYGLFISDSSTVYFYDGIIKGITGRHSGIINSIATKAQIFEDEEEINGDIYKTEYLVTETDIVINENTEVTYGNLQTAITQAKEGERLRLLTNAPLYYDINVNNFSNITLDLDGHTISTNKPWKVYVPFTITNTSEAEAVIKISTAVNLITNISNNLTINNVTLKNTSSSNYVVKNTGTLTLDSSKIDCLYGVDNSSNLTVNNSIINATSNTISNTGTMTITRGTYTGGNYSLYSNSSSNVNINNATFNGTFYNSGNNNVTATLCTFNGNFQNNTSDLTLDRSHIYLGRVSNSGILTMTDSSFEVTTSGNNYYSYYHDVATSNSGTLNLNHSDILVNREAVGKSSTAISNTGTLNVTNNSKVYIGIENGSYSYTAINTSSNGLTNIDNSEVLATGGVTNYGLYIDGANAKAVLLTGTVEAELASTGYGAYIDKGTFEMGHYEGQGVTADDVSDENPLVFAEGKSRGIGVKKVNASFNFYDGRIRASKYAKPETTTNVEYQFEVTTYIENDTGYEYAILEWMRNDYQGDTVCLLNGVYYKSVSAAIEKANTGDVITLLRSTEEDLTIPTNKNFKLDLNKHSITTHVINNGTFNVYNGSLQSFDSTTIVNRGTLILGEDDNNVSSSSIRIISEATTIQSTGTIAMYDGYIEGTTAVDGKINTVAQYARVRTVHDDQSEKKFIQSLSPEAIESGETDLIITIDPNTGIYEGTSGVREIFKKYGESYELSIPTKAGCDFDGWEFDDDSVYNPETGVITVSISDIYVKAKWKVNESTVARVGDDYYTTLQSALDSASDGDVVELLKDTTEPITNRANVKLDLGGFTVTGAFINQGELRIVNGTIENTAGIGMINQKSLTMGENDGNIREESVKIIGTTVGLQQDAIFKFYDGYIEGDIALNGKVDALPQGYFLYNDRNTIKNCQRVYLIGNPTNAVATIENGGTQYFFNLQSAIDTATITGDEIFIIKDFEAAYTIDVEENANILINMNGHDITMGNVITNDGTLRIYDSTDNVGSITLAKAIDNQGDLTIENITVSQTTSEITIMNDGTLHLVNAKIEGSSNNAVKTNGNMTMDATSKITSATNNYALYNNYNGLVLSAGEIDGIYNSKALTLNDGIVINATHSNAACVHTTAANSSLTMNGGTCTATNIGISLQGTGETFTMNGGSIKTTNQGVYVGNTSGADTVVINNGEIESTNSYGIQLYGVSHNLTVNNGTITSKKSTAIYTSNYSDSYRYNVNIIDGTIKGGDYGTQFHCANLNITGGTFETTAVNRDRYAIWKYYGNNASIKNATIIANNGSGMDIIGSATIEDTTIDANAANAYGIVIENGTLTLKDGVIINTPGDSSTGLLLYNSNDIVVNYNGATINSQNIGINTTTSSGNKTINVNSGQITGNNYGIKLASSGATLNVGNADLPLSTEVPLISGGLYGINKTDGTMNFYNGLLRGYNYGYTDTFYNIRRSKEITEEAEINSEALSYLTYSGSDVASSPVTKSAKAGDGYARITYIDETNDTCTNGETTNFSYSGAEETFVASCSGSYKLEVWGAQGGTNNSTYIGGYGGYSTGEISLTAGETLYINVGGQGTAGQGRLLGGYNGGGIGYGDYCSGTYRNGGSGGGATHIASVSGLLAALENNKASVIIVAGGGGGSHYFSSASGSGASGGGYIGNTSTWTNNGHSYYVQPTGGTQTAPGTGGYSYSGNSQSNASFGHGGDYDTQVCNEGSGGGAGWYGGGSGQFAPGAGGSGYIGNERLSNAYMYGYQVKGTYNSWIKNYLIDKDKFLQVGDVQFNSIDDASEYILDNLDGEGTILLLKDATIQEDSQFIGNTTITFDLNGKTLQSTKTIVNNSDLTIVDNTVGKTGLIYDKNSTVIVNHNKLHVVNGKIQSDNANAIVGDNDNGVIKVDSGVVIKGDYAIKTSTTYTITVDGATLMGATDAINCTGSSTKVTLTNATLSSTSDDTVEVTGASSIVSVTNSTLTAGDDAFVIRGDYSEVTIDQGTFTAGSAGLNFAGKNGTYNVTNSSSNGNEHGVYVNSYSMTINLTDNTIKSSSGIGINDVYGSNYGANNITVSGGTCEGGDHGAYIRYSNLTTSNTTIKTTGSGNGHYAIYTYYNSPTITINSGSKILAPNGSGIRNVTKTIVNAGEIKAEGTNAYGITNTDSGNLKVYGGTVYGKKYGIYQCSTSSITNIGNSESILSTETPLVQGNEYGIYTESGKSNFYSGRLKGNTKSYRGEFYRVRKGCSIYTFDEVIDENNPDVTRKVSYLTETIGFLQVGDDPTNIYNTFEDAIASITGTTETIKVLNDNMVYEDVVFPEGKDITLLLNDHKLTMTQSIVNNGTLSIVGGDNLILNSITNNTSEGIVNKGILNLEKVNLETLSVGIRGNSGTNPITITNSRVRARTAIQIDAAQPLTIISSNIEGTNGNAIGQSASRQKTVITDSVILASDSGVRQTGSNCITEITNSRVTGTSVGVYQSGSDSTLKITSSKILGNSYGVQSSGYRDIITIKDDTRIEGYDIGLYQNSTSSSDHTTITVNNSTLIGVNNGACIKGAEFNTTNCTITNSAANKDKYAAVCDSYSRCNFGNNTEINSQNASGVYVNTYYEANFDNTTVNVETKNGIGINAYDGDVNINQGANINTNGYESYGIYEGDYDAVVNINGGDVHSANVGIYVGSNHNNTKTVNVNKGNVIGEVYGIQESCSNGIVNIGSLSDTVSITDPYVEGGLISINKTSGTLNFYSGRLKGYVRGNPGTVDVVRTGYEIFDDEDEAQIYIRTKKTISTNDKSDLPISYNSKEGNGYARLTYEEYQDAGESNDIQTVSMIGYPVDTSTQSGGSESGSSSSTSENIFNFEYTGEAQKFTATRRGLYKIETWGATGGYSLCNGSFCTDGAFGGYSGGTIYLDAGTELYVYVGGAGVDAVVGQNSTGGYNGGGLGTSDGSDDETSGGGGGATDIRLVGGDWDNQASLASRIMVAAGGGGASWRYTPGYGGGLIGESYYSGVSPKATQTSGYEFGIGRDGYGAADSDGVAGGGGGYYGGNTANVSYKSAGGGGSSYISGHTGSIAIASENSTSPRTDSHNETCVDGTTDNLCSIHYSGYSFENTKMIDGAGYDWTYQKGDYIGQTQPDGLVTAGHDGDGYARITYLGSYDDTFSYSGDEKTWVVPVTGYYNIEAWGASGGNADPYLGGYGGYSTGKVFLNKDEVLYINVGGQGSEGYSSSGGYNGGGAAGANNAGTRGSGGGATHVSLRSGLLSAQASYIDDILIVAGGGGGADNWTTQYGEGGNGGGFIGNDGTTQYHTIGHGGSQSQGGAGYEVGVFGRGGSAPTSAPGGAGGGGGFYGGGSSRDNAGAGGGSGYIGSSRLFDKHMTCNNCQESNSNDTKTISSGDVSDTPKTDYSKIGDGYVKISYIGGTDIGSDNHTITLESSIGTIANPEIVYNDGDPLGNIPGPVNDNANMTFAGWYTDNTYTKKVDENTVVYMSSTLYAKFNYVESYCRTLEDTFILNFDYTGDEQTYQVECPGKYKVEVWGAQGGNATYNTYSTSGGTGGYSIGHAVFKQNEKLYINVGGQGNSVNYQQSFGTYTFDDSFGYNGGGYAILASNNSAHAGGGGATHIATRRGLLSSLKLYKNTVLIVAGGGGGAAVHKDYPNYSGDGGSGGGAVAGSGTPASTTCYTYGTGGTQNSIGSYLQCQNSSSSSRGATTHNADFGLGANFESNSTSAFAAGGGAGWYGGQAGSHAPGGGGSSYISSRLVDDAAMYGYNIEDAYTNNKSNIAYLIQKRNLIVNLSTDEEYSNLQDAIDDANNNETLQYIANDYVAYPVDIPLGKTITIDLNGYNIVESKQIINNGNLTLTNSSTEYTSKITNNTSVTQIVNNGTLAFEKIKLESYNGIENANSAVLVVEDADIEARNTGVNNKGRFTSEGSIIYGTSYDIYSSSDKTELISNTTLKSSSNAYYKYSNGDTTIDGSTVRGPINNARSGQPLEVKESVITSYIRNTGTSTYTHNEIKASIGNDSNKLIYNSGNLTLQRNDVEFKSTSTNSSSYDNTMIENHGTINSTNNDYLLKYDYNGSGTYTNRYRYLYQIKNYGLFTSTNDDYTTIGGQYMYFVYNESSNQSIIDNATLVQYHGSSDSYGLINQSGNFTIKDSTLEIYDSYKMTGIKLSAGNVNINNSSFNIHNSNGGSSYTSYGAYMENGMLTYDAGTMSLKNVYNAYGVYMANGDFEYKNGVIDLDNNTNSYGVYLNNSNAIYTQGTYDGRGTDEANVSVISPHISAIGTTTGLGVRMGGGTFNFYDGYILGSTSPRQAGDITSSTELNYQVVTKQDEVTGYNYCVLEYNK